MALQKTYTGQWWDSDTGMMYGPDGTTPMGISLDQSQVSLTGETLPVAGQGGFGAIPAEVGGDIAGTQGLTGVQSQTQATDFTPAQMSFTSPEAIARARSETPGMRAFDYYNMMQSAPGVRALGSTGRQIAQQRLPELQTRFGLGQYFGDMPGQGEDTFRGFMEAQPTAWGGQDWQNAMGGIRKGGMVSQAIEGYADMTPEQQFEQRTKFLAGMSGNEKGNLMILNEKGGR